MGVELALASVEVAEEFAVGLSPGYKQVCHPR